MGENFIIYALFNLKIIQTQIEYRDITMKKTCIECYGLWCQPDGMIGSKLRYLLRKGIPATLGMVVGSGVNLGLNSFIHTLGNAPQLATLELSGFIGIFSASIAYTVIDYGFEQCWHTNYQDNYREYSDNDFDHAISQLDSTPIATQTAQIYQSL